MSRKNPYSTKDPWGGWTLDELMSKSPDELSDMRPWRLRALVTRAASALNKRLRSLNTLNIKGPAMYDAARIGKFTAKGKDERQLVQEFLRMQRFYKDPTSTKKGMRQYLREIDRDLGDIEEKWGSEGLKVYWDQYSRWIEEGERLGVGRYEVSAIVAETMKGAERDPDELEKLIQQEIERRYKEREGARQDYDRASPNII